MRRSHLLKQLTLRFANTLLLIILAVSMRPSATADAAPRDIITPEIEKLLNELDAELMQSDSLEKEYRQNIDLMRHRYLNSTDLEQRYWGARELYEAYHGFDSDSALVYADICYNLATVRGREDWKTDALLKKVYIYSATGLFYRAEEILKNLDPQKLEDTLRLEYYRMKLFFETHRDQFLGRNEERVYQPEVESFLTEATKNMPINDPNNYWIMGWRSLSDTLAALKLIPGLRERLEGSKLNTNSAAMEAWMLSRLCEINNDAEGQLKYLILSAIADLRICNKEIASLEEVARILFQQNRLERANRYLTQSILYANEYKSRARVGSLARTQSQLFNAMIDDREMQLAKTRNYMIGLFIAFIVLLCALAFIIGQLRKLKHTRHNLSDVKKDLELRLEDLQSTRRRLEEANAELQRLYSKARRETLEQVEVNEIKEKYIARIFSICSEYVSKMDVQRRTLRRMLKDKKYDDLARFVSSPEISNEELKQLYASFDSIFLEIFPNFISDFNKLLREDEQIVPKKEKTLNTDLRIYALVRLGMNDSIQIAEFLHCSPQTVYNARQRTRNKSIVERDQFAKTVRSLGKPLF